MKKKTKRLMVALLAGGAMVVSSWGAIAADKPAPAQEDNAAVTQSASSDATYKELPDSATAAEVNGVKIPMQPINQAIESIKQQDPELASDSPEAQAKLGQYQHQILDNLVGNQLLLQEAEKQNIKPDSTQVQEQLQRIQQQFPTPEAYQQWLQQSGQTEESVQAAVSKNVAAEQFKEQLTSGVKVTDDDVTKFYEEHKEQFQVPESVQTSHILIAIKPNADEAEKKEAKSKAEGVLKEALASGNNFEELAKRDSDDDVSAAKGGDLGKVTHTDEGSWKPVVDAAFKGEPGKVVPELVETQFGYHIVKPIKKEEAGTLKLDEIHDQLESVVLQQKSEEVLTEEVGKLRKTADVKTNL